MEDAIELKPNGKIRLVLMGEDVLLRRPTIGEAIDFQEALWEAIEKEKALSPPQVKEGEEPVKETPKQRAERTRKMRQPYLEWVNQVLKTLGGFELPREGKGFDLKQIPNWIYDGGFAIEWPKHWESRPLALGSQAEPQNQNVLPLAKSV